jgi:hypothetical protein
MAARLWWPTPPAIVRYAVALASVAAALILARLLQIHLVSAPASLFLCAIMFSAWFGGARPALLAVILAFPALVYYFIAPVFSLGVEAREIPRLIIFALAAGFVVSLSDAQRRATESLQYARDDLSRTVGGSGESTRRWKRKTPSASAPSKRWTPPSGSCVRWGADCCTPRTTSAAGSRGCCTRRRRRTWRR